MRHRSGYGFAFSDRQDILQVLYDNLKDKSKVLEGKKLSLVRQQPNGVTVVCEDGSSYTGDILAGADGVNSKARSEMWRLADEQDPELVKADKDCKPSIIFNVKRLFDYSPKLSSVLIDVFTESLLPRLA